ncbi:MAG: B12-binding domain-containing radical SAM protein [Planctomycetes bacterium]|nr:B12-binding domain-containing radical SAM protein [Planctomycetota bacterium]
MAKMLIIQDMALEYFGVEILSAVAKRAGHETQVRILNMERRGRIWSALREWRPDLVAFPVMSVGYAWAVRLAREIKERLGIRNVFGGPHATFWPRLIDDYPWIDILCRGEGEGAIVDLLDAIDGHEDYANIPNLHVRRGDDIVRNEVRPLIEDLDALPFFDREIYFSRYRHLRDFPAKRFMTDRGCPHNCSFCFNHKLRALYGGKGKYLRIQSPGRAVAEIRETVRRYGARLVTFTNDSFTWNRAWMREFLDRYRSEIGLPFAIQCRVREFDAQDARRLKAAGCYSAMFGIESGSERVRREILNRRMTNEQIIAAAGYLKEAGIRVITANMFGMPTETLEEAWETVDLNIAIGTDVPSSTIFQAMPGTEAYEIARRRGLFVEDHDVTNVQTQFGGTNLKQPHIDEMVNLQRLFYLIVRFPILRRAAESLIRWNLNFLYKPLWAIGFALKYVRSRQLTLRETIRTGWYMRQIFLRVRKDEGRIAPERRSCSCSRSGSA